MDESLYTRVMAIAYGLGMTEVELEDRMMERGLPFPAEVIDTIASADDLRVIADILEVPSSIFTGVTPPKDDPLSALFEEMWDQYSSKINLPKDIAYQKVVAAEYRWNSNKASNRSQMELALKALEEVPKGAIGCRYPDCDCPDRCSVDGHLLGPEG